MSEDNNLILSNEEDKNKDNFYDEEGKVICQICKEAFTVITATHLKKRHNMSVNEYKEKYNSPVTSKFFGEMRMKKRVKRTNSNIKENESNIDNDLSKEIFESTGNMFQQLKDKIKGIDFSDKINNIIEKKKSFIGNINNIPYDKLDLLNFLILEFDEIYNNYWVEKIIHRELVYRLITDIACPSLKIDFEFPNAFWHNYDQPKIVRDRILKEDGWRIVNINQTNPKIIHLEEELSKLKLI